MQNNKEISAPATTSKQAIKHRAVVVGSRNDGGQILLGNLAIGEMYTGSQVLEKQDVTSVSGELSGDIKNGRLNVKGDWNSALKYGFMEFNGFAAAQAWLGTPEGKYFQSRFDNVQVLAVVAALAA
jgi:hypothetical protein